MTKLIILDRDGVINHDSEHYIKSAQEWQALPRALEAIRLLNEHQWTVAIATNQSGVARKLFDIATLHAIHQKMHQQLQSVHAKVSSVFFCPHTDEMNCKCRKPKPGMFVEIAKRYDVSLSKIPVVGDSLRDLQASLQLGYQPFLVKTGKGQKTLEQGVLPPNTHVMDDLYAVAQHLTNQNP